MKLTVLLCSQTCGPTVGLLRSAKSQAPRSPACCLDHHVVCMPTKGQDILLQGTGYYAKRKVELEFLSKRQL